MTLKLKLVVQLFIQKAKEACVGERHSLQRVWYYL